MSSDEIKQCFELFAEGDKIPRGQVATALRTMARCPTEEECQEMITGDTDLATFEALVGKTEECPPVEEILEAFSVFDQNSNGYIPVKELLHLMKSLGEGMSDDQLEQIRKIAEPDDEDQVNIKFLVDKIAKQL